MAENNSIFGDSSNDEAYKKALELLKQQEDIHAFNQKINSDFTGFLDSKRQLLDQENKIFERQKIIAKMEREGEADAVTFLKDRLKYDIETLSLQQQQLKNVNLIKMGFNSLVETSLKQFSVIMGDIAEYINEADGAYKELNKTIGLSGERSRILRENLISAAASAASLGVSFSDLAEIQGSFTSELGNAVLLSSQSLKDISQIAAGTQMGAEQAGIMAAKFNLMGKSVASVRDFYEDTVNQSAKFGVSADVVLKKINDNLDKSQKYVFKNGTQGLKNMAMYATKFKIDMDSVFNAIDKTNSLEGAVDAVAQLQVLGGKFAQVDPFKLLFESRNDAEAFTKTIQGMTSGMAFFNKTADKGNGEIQIAAGDLQRLKLAAEATGVSYESLIDQAKRGKQVNMIDQIIGGKMTKDQREFIEGAAELQKGGSFAISMNDGTLKDIRDLSGAQIDALKSSGKSLDDRAKEAMTFDKLVVNTMNELKSALLPILSTLDDFLVKLNNSGFLKGAMIFAAAGVTLGATVSGLRSVSNLLSIVVPSIKNLGGGFGRLLGNSSAADTIKNTVGAGATKELSEGIEANGIAAGGAWKNMLAFGGAVTEVGAGIWLATNGIASMATAFKGLNDGQLNAVNISLGILGGTLVAFSIGMGLLAPTLTAAAPGLLAFGGAVTLVGAGIGIATAGIGYMAKGFGELFDGLAKVGDQKVTDGLGRLMLSLTELSGEALIFANPLTWIGLKNLSGSIEDIGEKLENANFQNLNLGAAAFDSMANAIERINDKKLDKLIEVSESLGSIGSIANLFTAFTNSLGDGIEVKFSKDTVNLNVDVTAEMDGTAIGRKVSKTVALTLEQSKKGGIS